MLKFPALALNEFLLFKGLEFGNDGSCSLASRSLLTQAVDTMTMQPLLVERVDVYVVVFPVTIESKDLSIYCSKSSRM